MEDRGTRTRRCAVRLSEREYEAVRSAAEKVSCTMSDFMRATAVASALAPGGEGRRLVACDRREMGRLIYQVRAIGLQYNQALRALNALAKRDWVDPASGAEALEEIRDRLESIDADRAAALDAVRRMAESDRMLIGR